MNWNLNFEIMGKKRKPKRSVFSSIGEAKIFVNKFIKNYKYVDNEKLTAIITSEDLKKIHKIIFHYDGEFEYYIRNITNKLLPKKKDIIENGVKSNRIPQKKKRDFQRKIVYDWEEKVFKKYGFFKSILSENDVREFVNLILVNEGAPLIKVLIKNGEGSCFFKYYKDNSIPPILTLKRNWGLNKFVICHELAHYLVHLRTDLFEGGHSENFMGFYIYLLSKYVFIKEEQLWDSAIRNKIKLIKYSKKQYKSLLN